MSFDNHFQFNKLYCQFHPYELVTNFCNDQKCLIGLCATCICNHTEIHAHLGTVPRYQNIRDTFSSLRDELRNQITYLEENKNKLGSLRESVEVKKITIKKTIRQLKEETLNKVKEEFDSLEKKILTDIGVQEKKQGYHSNMRFETLDRSLMRETQTLVGYIEGLNSPNFLEWAKKLTKSALIESGKNRLQIEKQLEDNETYAVNLKWSQGFLFDVENIIRRIFTLEFVIPKPNGEMRSCVTPFRQSNISINNMSRSSSQPKLSYSLMRNNSLVGMSKFAQTSCSFFNFNEGEKSASIPLQKQSLLRKSTMNSSGASDCELGGSKENKCMGRSCYMGDGGVESKSMVMKNWSGFSRGSDQGDKLSCLIQAKKNSKFDSPQSPILIQENTNNGDSRMRVY